MKHLEKKIKADAAKKLGFLKEIEKWPKMLAALEKRPTPLKESHFCEKHGINYSRFNRLKNGKESILPSEKFFSQVRNAFKAEGF